MLNGAMVSRQQSREATPDVAEQRAFLAGLVEAVAQRKDRQAFAALFDHFAPRVKAFMRGRGVEDARADDLVQEVFLTVWQRAVLYDRKVASVSTWIFTIARNKHIDSLRRERRPEFDPEDPAFAGFPDPPADLQLSQNQIDARLRAAVEELPEEQALVLKKNFFEDKPHRLVAEELNLPLGTVKSRLRLALAKLRDATRDFK